jgi:hypothetical protein
MGKNEIERKFQKIKFLCKEYRCNNEEAKNVNGLKES